MGLRYRDGNPLVYDSGDFLATLNAALEAAAYTRFRDEQLGLRARGIYHGMGIAAYVEGTGVGPFEGARVRVDLSGHVVVATGAACQGQGHETSFAQIGADMLGVPLSSVTVIGGDTDGVAFGIGTYASRSIVTAGNAIAQAAGEVRQSSSRPRRTCWRQRQRMSCSRTDRRWSAACQHPRSR